MSRSIPSLVTKELSRSIGSIAKHPGHAAVAGKVFSTTAYEKPFWRYENAKTFLSVHVQSVLQHSNA